MILLDTDHLSVLQDRRHSLRARLAARLDECADRAIHATVVSLEEQMRGWLAELKRRRRVLDHVPIYAELSGLIDIYRNWSLVAFDEQSARQFLELREQKIHIGSQDLKIASIALVHDALLLSANLVHFQKVPGLRVEDWLYT